jgi:diguanylate cyclase (GGDEF)-like protein|tara:strand:+ start:965 stop:1759 length:795 start_codon:yes stop_codon:yes gene_type:complete
VNTIAAAQTINDNQQSATNSLSDISRRLRELLPFIPVRLRAENSECADEKTLLRAVDIILTEAEALNQTVREQSDRICYLEQLATTDELTKVNNRRGFELELNRTLSRAERLHEEGVLVYVDLDDFKPVNDTHGHAAGDEVLRHVANVLSENIREMDTVGRLGGDEFAVILTGTNREDGLIRAETLNQTLNQTSALWNGERIPVRASFGMQAYQAGDSASALMASADKAMYTIKQLKESEEAADTRVRHPIRKAEVAASVQAAF